MQNLACICEWKVVVVVAGSRQAVGKARQVIGAGRHIHMVVYGKEG